MKWREMGADIVSGKQLVREQQKRLRNDSGAPGDTGGNDKRLAFSKRNIKLEDQML